jgi:hypothetical protein
MNTAIKALHRPKCASAHGLCAVALLPVNRVTSAPRSPRRANRPGPMPIRPLDLTPFPMSGQIEYVTLRVISANFSIACPCSASTLGSWRLSHVQTGSCSSDHRRRLPSLDETLARPTSVKDKRDCRDSHMRVVGPHNDADGK